MKTTITVFLLLALTTPSVSNSQSNPDHDPYFVESHKIVSTSGPRAITRNILQDSNRGFWLATWNGAIRFDGEVFTNVTNKENLRPYRTFSLMEDNQKNIWIGTIGAGVYRYDGSTYTNFTTEDGLVHNATLSMLQDSKDNIWLGSMGVTKYDGTTFTTFDASNGFTSSDVNSIIEAPDGKIWFGTRGALFHFDGTTYVDFTAKHGLHIAGYIPALIDRQGHLWFSGQNGIYHFDGETLQHLVPFTSFSLMEDSHGNIWYSGGPYAGDDLPPGTSVLNQFDPAAGLKNILSASTQFKIENSGMIFGLVEDYDGNIWFGTGNGVGWIEGDSVRYY